MNVNLITLNYYFPLKINRFNDVMYASATSCTISFFGLLRNTHYMIKSINFNGKY